MTTNPAPELRIIATGGTIDKVYQPINGRVGFADESHVRRLLAEGRFELTRCSMGTVFLKDSADLTDADRELIAEACRGVPESRIVILHGTDTMSETAKFLATAGLAKTLVLTGSFVPWSMARSDAAFNVGSAVVAAHLLGQGVYVVMNGRVMAAEQVRKNHARGAFEDLAGTPPISEPCVLGSGGNGQHCPRLPLLGTRNDTNDIMKTKDS